MPEFLRLLFDTSDFPPRWECGTWTDAHGWTHVLADSGIFGAYLAIPCVLALFLLRRRAELPFPRVGWLFVAFILSCGTTHLLEATIFWTPVYRLSAVLKVVTAVASWATVAALIPIVPRVLTLKTPAQLEQEVERRTRELREAREAEKRLANMLETSSDAVVVIDADDRVTSWNQGAALLYGVAAADAVGRPVAELLDRPCSMGELRDSPDSTASLPARRVERRVGGELRHLSARLTPIRAGDGALTGAAEVARDLTTEIELRRQRERARRAEAERRHAHELEQYVERLERSNRSLEQFAQVTSHDLREPLRVVTSHLQLLERRAGDALDERARESLGFAVDGAARMMAKIQDLLVYSRLDAEQVEAGPVETAACVAEARRSLALLEEEARGTVEIGPLPRVRGDRSQLVHLFENLLGNALKYRRPEGPARVRVSGERRGDHVELRVADDGIGIPRHQRERVFEIFQRLHPAEAYPGTGVGLAICRRIVTRHGGEIRLEDGLDGRGTCVVVTLPAEVSEEGGIG